MDFKILEYIIAIAEAKNVTKAAEKLYISQSGLNQQLIKTEKELGTPLFYRTNKEMKLTLAGQIYIANAKRILKMAQNCVTQIQDLTDNPCGTISYGLPFEHGVDLFIDISEEFSQRFPNVSISLMEQTVKEMKEKIANDQLDMAFIMTNEKPSPNLFDSVKLCTEKLVLGIPASHPLAQLAAPPHKPLRTMDLRRLQHDRFAFMFAGSTMRQIIDPLFEDAGFIPDIRYETMMNNALYRLVDKGLCCTIMPQSYAKRSKATAWFYLEQDPSWNWYILFSKTRVLSSADRYLIELSRIYAQKMQNYWLDESIGTPQG